jgi:hypothetical protein
LGPWILSVERNDLLKLFFSDQSIEEMTSLQSGLKQIPSNAGYYITVALAQTTVYSNTGTDAAPTFNNGAFQSTVSVATVSHLPDTELAAGKVFRDHGKTLLSAGRVFRKVQLLISTNALVNGGTDGVGGQSYENNLTSPYITGYIELPGTGGLSSGTGQATPVARLG